MRRRPLHRRVAFDITARGRVVELSYLCFGPQYVATPFLPRSRTCRPECPSSLVLAPFGAHSVAILHLCGGPICQSIDRLRGPVSTGCLPGVLADNSTCLAAPFAHRGQCSAPFEGSAF